MKRIRLALILTLATMHGCAVSGVNFTAGKNPDGTTTIGGGLNFTPVPDKPSK